MEIHGNLEDYLQFRLNIPEKTSLFEIEGRCTSPNMSTKTFRLAKRQFWPHPKAGPAGHDYTWPRLINGIWNEPEKGWNESQRLFCDSRMSGTEPTNDPTVRNGITYVRKSIRTNKNRRKQWKTHRKCVTLASMQSKCRNTHGTKTIHRCLKSIYI